MFLSHTPPRGGQEQLACMCVRVWHGCVLVCVCVCMHVLFVNARCCVHSAGVGQW